MSAWLQDPPGPGVGFQAEGSVLSLLVSAAAVVLLAVVVLVALARRRR